MKFFKSLPKEKLQKVILAAIGILIALALVGYFFIASELNTIVEQRERVSKLTAQVQELEDQVKTEATTAGMREQMKAFIESQLANMIYGDPYAWSVREMNLLAESHPVHEFAVAPGNKADGAHFSMFISHIGFSGSYDEIGHFVRDLENRYPLSQIRNLTLSGGGSDKDCHAALDIALAIRPPEAVKPAEKKDTAKPGKNSEGKKA